MVRLGILCEGESETYILKSDLFQNWLYENNIDLVEIRIVKSKNQYWEDRLESHILILQDLNVEQILIMVDLDEDACITETKNKIVVGGNQHIVVSVKEFENWYLADNVAVSKLIGRNVNIDYPENDDAVGTIIQLNNGRGFGGSKPRLAMKMRNNGFSIQNAANHPNCPSATYFLSKLEQIAKK
ncbi:hypothetical protein [Dyadobacter frigoris]|uniref:DUF4276 family protein n=1 Tax=Dyadobacter frigoris TaxID=2576211 RepID=A0A4U6D431_9BACT|nr:hypothetical protein [Dyadobacter frigoris]TKT92069.1 hypothetical protein FDK13_13120 [Dyadobacter frigoris]